MALLIIGGLLVVALLAILGAVFLSRTDHRAIDHRATKAHPNGSVTVSNQGAIPLAQQSSVTNAATERTNPPSQNLPATVDGRVSPTSGSQQQFTLNGQFHELTVELQTLYQHAYELERRLRTLSEVANRIEKTQGDQVSTEQEIH